ncbi:oligopeptide ABC transporter substrate-binding protein OppA [Kitasatospora sp. CMC57]|uniref:Oligopeptide ABC transporter substrate-binding protein OppA n=1 Tax=Kitasatospora sp. CMC57 TaxID=3231513 RepID=A0AB33JT62_9ACTN
MRARKLLAVAVLTVLLAGCSEDPASRPAASDVTTVARDQVRDGGTLRWAVETVPATLNVFQPEATADSELLAEALLPHLFRLDDHARATADPDYLAAAESTPAGQTPQTVTYRLNPKAVWSDGTPITAADFTAQWHALGEGADPAYRSDHPAGYAAISAVTQGADAHEVKVTFKQPYAGWRTLFSPLYPAAATATPAAFNQPLTNAPSAGPFTVKTYDRDGGKATVVRNPLWWGDPAKAEAIDFVATPAAKRLDALDQGALDIAALTDSVDHATPADPKTSAAPPDAAALAEASAQALRRAEALPGLKLYRAAAPSFAQLTLNGTRGPLADPAVRRAVARAVDRQRIADAAVTPLGLAAVPLGHHLLMAGQDGYQDNSSAIGTTSAAELLDRAGWHTGGAARTKDGKELALGLLIPEGSASARRVADALTAELAAAGITLRPQAVPAESFLRDHLATGEYDLALFSWPATSDPAGASARYSKPRPGPDGLPVVGRNYARTGSEEIDQLLAAAGAELDPAARQAVLQKADARIWQLAHSVPLYQRPDLVAVRTGVVNVGAFGFATPRFQDLGLRRS